MYQTMQIEVPMNTSFITVLYKDTYLENKSRYLAKNTIT